MFLKKSDSPKREYADLMSRSGFPFMEAEGKAREVSDPRPSPLRGERQHLFSDLVLIGVKERVRLSDVVDGERSAIAFHDLR